MIYEILSEGEANARTGKSICDLLHISARDLTSTIEAERRDGKPICATTSGNNPGYFIAASQKEMERYCKSLEHRENEIRKTRNACSTMIPLLPAMIPERM